VSSVSNNRGKFTKLEKKRAKSPLHMKTRAKTPMAQKSNEVLVLSFFKFSNFKFV